MSARTPQSGDLTKRPLKLPGWRIWLAPGATADDARAAIQDLPSEPSRHYLLRDLCGVRAMVKIYNRRPGHSVVRRLRPGRSVREAAGYAAFARVGIPTPRLLLWGEERRHCLLERGLIATQFLDVPTVAEAHRADSDESRRSAMESLVRVHVAGLAHGDPRTRNFLATPGHSTVFDLCSWGPLTNRSQTWDLVQFLGSVRALTGDDGSLRPLLKLYGECGGPHVDDPEKIVAEAIAYAAREGTP